MTFGSDSCFLPWHALAEVKALLAYLLCVSSGEPIPSKALGKPM